MKCFLLAIYLLHLNLNACHIELEYEDTTNAIYDSTGKMVTCHMCKKPAVIFIGADEEITRYCINHAPKIQVRCCPTPEPSNEQPMP